MEYLNNGPIIWSYTFNKELQNIYEYIAFYLKEPITAKKLYSKIISSISSLSSSPERYSRLHYDRYNHKNIRKLPINNYIIIYEVDNDTRTSIYFTYIP